MADEIPVVQTPSTPPPGPFTPSIAKPVPESLKGVKFEMDDKLTSSGHEVMTIEDKHGIEVKQPVVIDKTKTENIPLVKVEDKVKEVAPTKVEDKKEDIKVEDKKEDKPKEEPKLPSFLKAPKTEAKVEDKPKTGLIPPLDGSKVIRDYTGYSNEEVTHLKQMSDSAYQYTVNLIKANKENEQKASGIYLQHPEAYTLSPEYNKLVGTNIQASRELQLYSHLLNEVKEGKEIQIPEDYKDGKFIFSKGTVKPTAQLEEDLRSTIYNLQHHVNLSGTKLSELKNGFKNQVTNDLNGMNDYRMQNFDWNKNPELLKCSMDCGDLGERTLQQIKDDVKAIMPAYMRNHPLAEFVGDMMISLRWVNALLAEAQSGKQVAEVKVEEAARGEPTSGHRPSNNGKKAVNGVSVFTMEGAPS